MTGVNKRKLAVGAAATILLAQESAAAWMHPRVGGGPPRRLLSGFGQLQGGGGPSRTPLRLGGHRAQHEETTPPPPLPPQPLSAGKSLLDALPMDVHDPMLWRGQWMVKASNEFLTSDDSSSAGFVSLELDHKRFKAVGTTSDLLASHAVSRNGSFTLLPGGTGEKAAAGGKEDGHDMVGEVEFSSKTVEIHPLGLPLPAPISPSHVRDLGGKRRRVMVKVMGIDSITLVFQDTKSFYVLERVSPAAQQAQAAASPSSTPAIRLLIVTNVLSLLASGIAEGVKHEAAVVFDAIMRR